MFERWSNITWHSSSLWIVWSGTHSLLRARGVRNWLPRNCTIPYVDSIVWYYSHMEDTSVRCPWCEPKKGGEGRHAFLSALAGPYVILEFRLTLFFLAKYERTTTTPACFVPQSPLQYKHTLSNIICSALLPYHIQIVRVWIDFPLAELCIMIEELILSLGAHAVP